MLQCIFPRSILSPPFLYRSNALPPSNCPGPLGLTLRNKWAFKTSPSGLQFASQRPGIAGKQRALFAKRILKQLPFTSAVQECWARQNNEPSVHSSSFPCLYPLSLNQSSPRMAESPFTSAHPVYILKKTVFWPHSFLFSRALAKSFFKPQPFVRWYPIYPALSSDEKMPLTSEPFLVYHP